MTLTPFLSLLKVKSVKWTLIGLASAVVCLPLISTVLPYVFPDSRAKSGSYPDVVEIKEISLLSVQRLQFSKVITVTSPPNLENDLENPNLEIFIRRIMRGHVTTSVDFSKIDVTNSPDGKVVVKFPELVTEPFIDQWIYYDSKGTGDKDNIDTVKEMTKAMDGAFRETMLKAALQTNRVERAKQQAERIVKMLYPDLEFEPRWPEDSKSGESAPVDAKPKGEATETSHE